MMRTKTLLIDLALVSYILFICLPDANSSLTLTLRFGPDLELMLLIILLLTVGWDIVRLLWAIWRWRASN